MIRKANKNDIESVCDLILMASSCLFKDILKTDDASKHKLLLKEFYLCKNTKFYFKNILVYILNKEVAGCIVSYDTMNEKLYNKTMQSMLNEEYLFKIEGKVNSIYIDSLAVTPKYRGYGLSKTLIQEVINSSPKDISLLVEEYKEDTRLYYERMGFKSLTLLHYFNTNLYRMVYVK